HLMQLQEKYKDSGLEVIGVAACEDAPTADEARTKLDAWLSEKFSNLNYRIAFDFSGEMKKLWLEPSFSIGIPTSFVVDRDGHIAFIGYPMQLDDVLPKVINGSWRTSDEAKAGDAKWIAENEPIAREQALKKPILEKFRAARKTQDWKTALSAIEEGVALLPDNVSLRVIHANLLLHEMRDMRAGLPVMQLLVRDAVAKNSDEWLVQVLDQLFQPGTDNSHIPSAERFAMGKELSEHILALPLPLDDDVLTFIRYRVVAQYFYESGNKDRAIELVEVAMKSLGDSEFSSQLLQTLANYKGEKVCFGDLCAVPQKDFPNVKAQAAEDKPKKG
ncbi:TlpA disulfide reductase family protein, partial [Bradyrhizobium sp. Arg314]